MLFGERIDVYCEKHINTPVDKLQNILMLKQVVHMQHLVVTTLL
jgi:hypothetical protein